MNKRDFLKLSSLALLAGSAGGLTTRAFQTSPQPNKAPQKSEESVLDRILRTGKIRGGYVLWPTYLERDPNTGKFSGLVYDYVQALAKTLGVQLEMTYETSYADYATALYYDKFDLFTTSLWADGQRQHLIDYTTPYAYQTVHAWVRKGDRRFDNNLAAINDWAVKISTIDGEISEDIRKTDFPEASVFSMPQSSDASQLLLNVITGKADVAFKSEDTVRDFLKTNPGTLQKVKMDRPIRSFAEVLAVKRGQHDLRRALTNISAALLNNGGIERIISRHERHPGSFYRVATPFENGVAAQ